MKTHLLHIASWLNQFIRKIHLERFGWVGRIKHLGKRILTGSVVREQGPVLIRAMGGSMYVSLEHLMVYGLYPFEPFSIKLFKQALKPGMTVLDIGAHCGLYSLIAAQIVGKQGKVYAFEPAPDNFAILKRNIKLRGYDNIVAINNAVGDRDEIRPFLIGIDSSTSGFYPQLGYPSKETCLVETVTIDNYLNGQPVNVIKMDIEGNESYALVGMRQTIVQSNNLILLVEFNPGCLLMAKVNPDDFLNQLKDLGFDIQMIDENRGRLVTLNKSELHKRYNDLGCHPNLYCIKGEGEY